MHNIAIIVLGLIVVIFALIIAADAPEMPSSIELDEIACSQMRESGWTEKEIKDFMDKSGGCYDRETDTINDF